MRCVACAVSLATWLLFTFVPRPLVVLCVWCPWPLGSCAPVCPFGVLCCVCGVLCHLAHVHPCTRSVCCVACAVSWATWFLSTGVPARCFVLRVRCPGPFGSCAPVCPLGVLCCVFGVPGHLAPVHRCTSSLRFLACAVSSATGLLFAGALCCVWDVLRHLAPVRWCARSLCCVACAVSWTNGPLLWVCLLGGLRCVCGVLGHFVLFHGVPARCVVLLVLCPEQCGSCSSVCLLGALCGMCGVLGHLVPLHRCTRSVPCVVCAVSWATWLLFTGVHTQRAMLPVWWPGPLGSWSPVCTPGSFFCVCGVLGHLAPVPRCARSVCSAVCAVSWATWLPFTSVLARGVVLRVRRSGRLGSCSPVCTLSVLCCVCRGLSHLAPVYRCAQVVPSFACAVSWAAWLLFTGVHAACCVVCDVSWANWLLFTGVHARRVALCVRCPGPLGSCSPVWLHGVLWCVLGARSPGPLGSCSPVFTRGAFFCVCGVLGHFAPVHRCARSACSVACAVSSATWLLFTGVQARRVVSPVQCPGPIGSCSTVCMLGVMCCVCGVLGHLTVVLQCARPVCCVACAVSSAT